jgi:hypothetical protein
MALLEKTRESKTQVSNGKGLPRSRGGSAHQRRDAPNLIHTLGCCALQPPRHLRRSRRARKWTPTRCRRAPGSGLHRPHDLQESCAHVLLGPLDLRGGGSCRVLGSDALLKGHGGLIQPDSLISTGDGRVGDDDPASPTTSSIAPAAAAAAVGSAASAGWGRDASWPSLVDGGADMAATDSVPTAVSSGIVVSEISST